MPTMNCLNCGKEFEAARSTAKFCSTACKLQYNRKGQPPLPTEFKIGDPQTHAVPSRPPALDARIKEAQALARSRGFELITGDQLAKTEFIPTAFPELNALIKGFPRRRITEIYGPPSVGKTTLMLSSIAKMDAGLKILYVDMENAIDSDWMMSLGLAPFRLELINPMFLEDAAEHILDSLKFDYDLIVFDSVASALYRTEESGDMGEHHVGLKAKLMTQFIRKLSFPLAQQSRTAMVFINQEKDVIGKRYTEYYTPGGKALEYACSLRLRLTSRKMDRIKGGKKVNVEVTKNKVGKPYEETSFVITY